MIATSFVVLMAHLCLTTATDLMCYPLLPTPLSNERQAESILEQWQRHYTHFEAVQRLTAPNEKHLLAVLQHILRNTGDVNVDHQDVWAVLSEAAALQFGMATADGLNRIEVLAHRLWCESTTIGDATLPAYQILLAIQSGATPELDMDELTRLLEYIMRQAGEQAEMIFGHGLDETLGESIQVMMLVSRR